MNPETFSPVRCRRSWVGCRGWRGPSSMMIRLPDLTNGVLVGAARWLGWIGWPMLAQRVVWALHAGYAVRPRRSVVIGPRADRRKEAG